NKISHIKTFLSENRTVRQTILKNTFWLSFGEVIGRLLRAAVIIYAARVLGVEGFGIFSYVLGLAGLLTIFSDLGMAPVVVREGAKDPELRARYFSTALGLSLGLALISSLIIIFGAPLVTKFPVSQMLVALIALVFVFDIIRGLAGSAIFRASEKMEGEAAVSIATQAIVVVAGFILVTNWKNPESLALAYAMGSLGGLLLALYLVRHYLRRFISRFDRSLIKPMLAASIPMSLTAILGAVMINTDTVLLGWLTDAEQVGFFAAAQKPVLLLYLIPSFLAGGIFPLLARSAEKDRERFRLLTERGLSAVFLFALPITIGLVLLASPLVDLLYGAAYSPATTAFQILGLTILAVFPASMLVNGIFAYNEQKFLTKVGAVGVVINLFLDLMLIPLWGIAGCALATLLVQSVSSVLIWRRMKKLNDFAVFRSLRKIAIATVVMGAFILAFLGLGLPVLLVVLVAAMVYFAMLLLLKEKLFRELRAVLAG
ncbi:MAG: flippase, partial [Candidatus Colwellbacteria bacterium]